TGSFRVANDGFGGAAETFALNSFAAGNNSLVPNLIRLTNREYQDFVIAVPEPETYALMIAGLMAVGFISRRRKV
ncbi:MAG TPA: PEP-CTERM sorting domain-containing protein, partial [Caldimonas sp.]|nr:PEP-CTERM sorting domain-containing protein [Caldimonas sp.]